MLFIFNISNVSKLAAEKNVRYPKDANNAPIFSKLAKANSKSFRYNSKASVEEVLLFEFLLYLLFLKR